MFSKTKNESSDKLKEAEEKIHNWFVALGVDGTVSQNITKAVIEGRLSFDTSTEIFSYKLLKPVKKENGENVSIVSICEPDGADLEEANKFKTNEMRMVKAMIMRSSNLPLGIVDRIKQRDLAVLGELYSFFN